MTTNSVPPHGAAPDPLRNRGEFLKSYVVTAEERVAEPFRGVTAAGVLDPELFPIRGSGVSTAPIMAAAQALLQSLDAPTQERALFDVESDAWRKWSNIHPPLLRHGAFLGDLDARQRGLALDLLRAGMSADGFNGALGVMRLNETIGEMTGNFDEYGEQRYWVSIFGSPSDEEPWGFQFDGHHLNLNYFVLRDQVVMTPLFMGSEPVFAEAGKYAGTRVFAAEEDSGLRLMRALSAEQQRAATIGTELPPDVFATAFRDNLILEPQGLRYDELDSSQQPRLMSVIETYVRRLRDKHADLRMEEVADHLADTRFGWIGSTEDTGVFYYRVHSPVILIEFDHQRGVAFRGTPVSRNHIHTLVRTPNGNDYGKDLLRQHYQRHQH